MKVFISWSGNCSKQVAEALRDWLPLVLHYVKPWLSSKDISAGERWASLLARELNDSSFGIICLTRDNISADWILFESGALSKSLEESRVVPYLFDLDTRELGGPLAQFQAKKTGRESTLDLLRSINQNADSPVDPGRLNELFDALWPKFEARLRTISAVDESSQPLRTGEEIMEEIVTTMRSLETRILNLEKSVKYAVARPVSGGDRDDDMVYLELLNRLLQEARVRLRREPQNREFIRDARIAAEQCLFRIKRLFIEKELSDEAKKYSDEIRQEAQALLNLTEETEAE